MQSIPSRTDGTKLVCSIALLSRPRPTADGVRRADRSPALQRVQDIGSHRTLRVSQEDGTVSFRERNGTWVSGHESHVMEDMQLADITHPTPRFSPPFLLGAPTLGF